VGDAFETVQCAATERMIAIHSSSIADHLRLEMMQLLHKASKEKLRAV
jgi:hypothetical protein